MGLITPLRQVLFTSSAAPRLNLSSTVPNESVDALAKRVPVCPRTVRMLRPQTLAAAVQGSYQPMGR